MTIIEVFDKPSLGQMFVVKMSVGQMSFDSMTRRPLGLYLAKKLR
jgi:hypothetical protein